MQKLFACFIALVLCAPALAQQTRPLKFDAPGNEKTIPVRPPKADNSCAAYGAGFVKLAGSDTCVKVGGSVSVEGGSNVGRR
jgi:hypothetical protein